MGSVVGYRSGTFGHWSVVQLSCESRTWDLERSFLIARKVYLGEPSTKVLALSQATFVAWTSFSATSWCNCARITLVTTMAIPPCFMTCTVPPNYDSEKKREWQAATSECGPPMNEFDIYIVCVYIYMMCIYILYRIYLQHVINSEVSHKHHDWSFNQWDASKISAAQLVPGMVPHREFTLGHLPIQNFGCERRSLIERLGVF